MSENPAARVRGCALPNEGGFGEGITRSRSIIALFKYRHTAGKPVDVDVVFSFARGQRDAPAIGPAVGKEPDRTDLFADQIALRGVELEVESRRQTMRARIGRHAESAAVQIELEQRLGALGDGLIARKAQTGGNFTRRALQVGRRHAAAEHWNGDAGDERHEHEHDE